MMSDNAALISKLKMLINAQVTDSAWISAVNHSTGMDIFLLTIEYWNKIFDEQEMGSVVEIKSPDGLVWYRPDGGTPMAVLDPIPHHITLARFLMLAGIIKAMKMDDELSFVTIGWPLEWNKCTVYLNGKQQDLVIKADALLGIIEYYAKDKNGKLIMAESGNGFERAKISGMVKIVVNKNVQTFF